MREEEKKKGEGQERVETARESKREQERARESKREHTITFCLPDLSPTHPKKFKAKDDAILTTTDPRS
jgi:hypothetical protein